MQRPEIIVTASPRLGIPCDRAHDPADFTWLSVRTLKEKGLGAIAAFLIEGCAAKIRKRIRRSIQQATEDLQFAEESRDKIWKVLLTS